MRAIGWRPRAAGWFTRQITAGYLGVVALGSASAHSRPGTAEIMLHVGIRDEATEQVASQLCGLKDEGYRQRTATAGIGYLLPDRSWRQWEITPGNTGELARQLAAHVQRYAEPYLHQLSSDHSVERHDNVSGNDTTMSVAAAVGVAGGHQHGDGVLAGLDVPLQGCQPLVAADSHEQGALTFWSPRWVSK
jgi:hypothetical protein